MGNVFCHPATLQGGTTETLGSGSVEADAPSTASLSQDRWSLTIYEKGASVNEATTSGLDIAAHVFQRLAPTLKVGGGSPIASQGRRC